MIERVFNSIDLGPLSQIDAFDTAELIDPIKRFYDHFLINDTAHVFISSVVSIKFPCGPMMFSNSVNVTQNQVI